MDVRGKPLVWLHGEVKTPPFSFLKGRAMDQAKQQQLEAKGWRVGSVEEFLELTPEEASYIELKLTLSESLRAYRKQRHLTQMDLAKLLKSSQSRVAKMEAGDPSVSLDLLVRSLLAMGASREALAQMISSSTVADG
jgi:predicted XRE-type DNA-binding protein